jgi:hypothetical protein
MKRRHRTSYATYDRDGRPSDKGEGIMADSVHVMECTIATAVAGGTPVLATFCATSAVPWLKKSSLLTLK